MGQPRKSRKKYNTPPHPWNAERIKNENKLMTKYGLKNKKEMPEEWKNGEPKEYTEIRYIQRYSPYIFALQLMDEVTSTGVDLLYDCIVCDPIMEDNICKGVLTESKSGTEYYGCKMLIDTTGDCDVLRRGGVREVRRCAGGQQAPCGAP